MSSMSIAIQKSSVYALLEMISSDTPPTSDIQETPEVPFAAAWMFRQLLRETKS